MDYKDSRIGFVLSPDVSPAGKNAGSAGDGFVSVPIAALDNAERYIRALEHKVAELSAGSPARRVSFPSYGFAKKGA
jgi:hypothetical protein